MQYRYRDIADELLEEITQGSFRVGDKLPSEELLTERFQASRNTIRQSLGELEIRGYIKRHRGTRSTIIANKIRDRFTNSLQSIEELLQYTRFRGSELISQVLSVTEIDDAKTQATHAKLNEEFTWQQLKVVRTSKDGVVPFGYFEIFVASQFTDAIQHADLSVPIYQILEEKAGRKFAVVKQTISSGVATKDFCKQLKVPLGSPVLQARTEFITEDQITAEIGMAYFPADRYQLEVTLKRER